MPTIIELIEDYPEGDFLDFKREEYKKEQRHELIKDVLAFANSEHIGDRYIIIGVKKNGNEIQLFDVEAPEDSANIQSIIHDNIKPDLNVDYVPFTYKQRKLVVLTIRNPTDKPYSTKKNVTHSSGLAFPENTFKIRKGSRIKDISRDDLDRIYSSKLAKKPNISDKLKITFKDNNEDSIQLSSIGKPSLPSDVEWIRLQNEIIKTESFIEQSKVDLYLSGANMLSSGRYLQNNPKKLANLQVEQKRVKLNFKEKDAFALYEQLGHKVQFIVHNSSDFTLKNSTLIIYIDYFDGLYISDEVVNLSNTRNLSDEKWYPNVTKEENGGYMITSQISDIKHKLPHELLPISLRMYFDDKLKGQTIQLRILLHCENYHDVFTFKKYIEVL